LLVGIAVGRKTEKGRVDCRDFAGYVGGIGTGLSELVLEQEAFDLIVIDAHGDDDGAEGTIVSSEAAADFLGGPFEAANGEEGVDASAD
jgi:hypothetical protein